MKDRLVILLEEHNEAFWVWHWAIVNGFLKDQGNSLIHIDEHSDMGVPRFRSSVKAERSLEELLQLTYREIPIAGFIVPAIYQGVFSEVSWVKRDHGDREGTSEIRYIRSYNKQGKRLVVMKELDARVRVIDDPDRKRFRVSRRSIDSVDIGVNGVLDIDLDVFSAVEVPGERQRLRVEITQEEFENFTADKYHPLRYLGHRVEALAEKGRFYYEVDATEEV